LSVDKSNFAWVPAKIDRVLELSQNRRQVLIYVDRKDLNKRDLLKGDPSLSGLGEDSEALVSISSQTAFQSIKSILRIFFEQRLISWRDNLTYT